MRKTALFCILFLTSSCLSSREDIVLPGKIVASSNDGYTIYDHDKEDTKVPLMDNKYFWHSSLKWFNQKDVFVGIEGLKTQTGATSKSNIVFFDLKGNLNERIYESREGEFVGYAYPSKSDKLLLFTTEERGNLKDNHLEGLSRKQSVVLMNLTDKKVLNKIEDVGSSPNLQFEESPWIFDESGFVYSLTNGKVVAGDQGVINPSDDSYAGVYIFMTYVQVKRSYLFLMVA